MNGRGTRTWNAVAADRRHSPTLARDAGERAEHIIETLLAGASRAASIELVAETMGTSVRTLQRRLRTVGLTYSEVVRRARRAAAQKMLTDREAGIGEIARALGYSHPGHFTRAFEHWTGSTPREFRAGKRGGKRARKHADSSRHRPRP
jgi:AraC-like DNA-binding protein